jgi:CRISPR-associated protein Csx14
MAKSSIPVDLFNPGQVFACFGLIELAEMRFGSASAAFDWRDPTQSRFLLQAGGSDDDPIAFAWDFLRAATVEVRAPSDSRISDWKSTWGPTPTSVVPGRDTFPFPSPTSPATWPAVLAHGELSVEISYWGDDVKVTGRDNAKFWGGAGGYPGGALTLDALGLIRNLDQSSLQDPLNAAARQSSSFRFDWRRDYIPIDIGFSLNAHSKDRFSTMGYPIVEILAAIGLTHARPKRNPKSKLIYEYGVMTGSEQDSLLPATLLRAVLGNALLPFETRLFLMRLDWPAKEGNERCITTVEEITNF